MLGDEGDPSFLCIPPEAFVRLALGYRGLEELRDAWPDIVVNGTTPYISYLNNSMIGTFEGLKMAHYNTTIGDWEYEILPLMTGIDDKRTSIVYKQGTVPWVVALGYASDDFNLVYLRPEE